MTVELQVRDVRAEIYRVSGGSSELGQPATALLGRLFHEVFAELVGTDPRRNLGAALAEAGPSADDRRGALVHHAYRLLVGPRLRRHQAHLHESAAQVLNFWVAIQELCGWLAELHASAQGALRLRVEQPLAWELRRPHWTDAVRLTGVADSVLQVPGTGRWCVVELKLGRTAPEADLAQTCLYHQMIAASRGSDGVREAGTLALVSFEPRRRERLFEAGALHDAQGALDELIGRLADVLPKAEVPGRPTVAVAAPAAPATSPEHAALGRRLVQTLKEYGASIALDGPPVAGPTFLRFPVTLGPGVKLSAVKGRADEVRIRLGLEAPPRIGIERGRVVIDLQRPDRRFIRFEEIRGRLPEADPLLGCAQVPLGVDLEGQLRLADLAQPEHAHLLIAGTTGSGKSEWLRVAVAGLIASNTPKTLRLLLIDPKRNAFGALRDSLFLYAPIVYPEETPVVKVLKGLADVMDARYEEMSRTGTDTLAEHVQRLGSPIARIVCICDEYADLVLQGRKERRLLEEQIFRLGAKARAAGIHLVLATQQPSREIIRGTLDANIAARIALKMDKEIESRMLLGVSGAETLLGYGDLLFKDIGEPIRLQSAYIPPDERELALGMGGGG